MLTLCLILMFAFDFVLGRFPTSSLVLCGLQAVSCRPHFRSGHFSRWEATLEGDLLFKKGSEHNDGQLHACFCFHSLTRGWGGRGAGRGRCARGDTAFESFIKRRECCVMVKAFLMRE